MARQILTDLDFANVSRILNLPDGVGAQEPATVAQLQAAIEGLNWKDDVRVSTQSNISIASPGAAINGITMTAGDRFVARFQTSQPENGIYIWNGAAVPATRTADANVSAELNQAVVIVREGTDAGAAFRQSTLNPVIGTDNIVWASFGVAAPSASETTAGILLIATQTKTDTGTDDASAVTPLKLATWSKAPKRFQANIGDGSATQYTVTHNLGTYDVQVAVFRNSGNRDDVDALVERTSTNAVRVKFSAAPTTNQFRVVILG